MICSHGIVFVIPKYSGYMTRKVETESSVYMHGDVIKWKHFLHYWSFVRGIHRSPVDSFHKGQWRGALLFSLICPWTNGWASNRVAGDLRRHRAHYDVIVSILLLFPGNAGSETSWNWPGSPLWWQRRTSLYCQNGHFISSMRTCSRCI